jgi:hypothetical protein
VTDAKRPAKQAEKAPPDVGVRSVAASGDTRIGNIRVGDIVGQTVITGDSNTVTVSRSSGFIVGGDVAVRAGDRGGVAAGRDVSVPKEMLPVEQALGRIADAVRLNLGQLQLNMEQARKESSQFFRATLVFSGIGFIVILFGVGLMMAGLVTVGMVTTAASVIPQAGAFLLFNKDKELRRTIEAYHGYILDSQKVLTMIDLAETIGQDTAKDSIKEQIILAVLKVKPAKGL